MLQPEPDCLALTVKPLILNLFRLSYQLSSSGEHRQYLIFKIVFIFAVQLSFSNFKIFLQPYTKQFYSFLPVSTLLGLKINIFYAVTLVEHNVNDKKYMIKYFKVSNLIMIYYLFSDLLSK